MGVPNATLTATARGRALVLAILAAAAGVAAPVAGQRGVFVAVGEEGEQKLVPGATVSIPILLDPAAMGGVDVASATVQVVWSPCLSPVSVKGGPRGNHTFGPVNLDSPGAGSQEVSWVSTAGQTAPLELVTYTFNVLHNCHGRSADRGAVTARLSALGDQAGNNILDRVARTTKQPVVGHEVATLHGRLATCVGYTGPWGDVTSDDRVNLIDAQQIARWTVSLSTLLPDRVPEYGDVLVDGYVDVIDAQQIARYALALSTSSLAGQPGPDQCAEDFVSDPARLILLPGDTFDLAAGRSTRARAVVLEENGAIGRYDDAPPVWASSDPGVVDVTEAGLLLAVGPGTAVISATTEVSRRILSGTALVTVHPDGAGGTPAVEATLSVTPSGTGDGRVQVGDAIDCAITAGAVSGSCDAVLEIGTVVTLEATPEVGSVFSGWGEPCRGTSRCVLLVDRPLTLGAAFAAAPGGEQVLTIIGTGGGAGTVTSDPPGLACTTAGGSLTGACEIRVTTGTQIVLRASPATGSRFVGWGSPCFGNGMCVLTMDGPATITAEFELIAEGSHLFTLAALTANANGRVISQEGLAPAIDCTFTRGFSSGACSATYHYAQLLTLTAIPAAEGVTTAWTGDCVDIGPHCQVSMDRNRSARAGFLSLHPFTLEPGGSGAGVLRGAADVDGRELECRTEGGVVSGTCDGSYPWGTQFQVAATADAGDLFAGWTTSECDNRLTTCLARFGGSGSRLSPPPISTSVGVEFAPAVAVSVRGGAGDGRVTGGFGSASPHPAIDCHVSDRNASPEGCDAEYPGSWARSTVPPRANLLAAPDSGFLFRDWTLNAGAQTYCGSNAQCSLVLDGPREAVAAFDTAALLGVAGAGGGRGRVTGPGISCTLDGGVAAQLCEKWVVQHSSVTLIAIPFAGSLFTGWGQTCSGVDPTCVAVMARSDTAVARFDLADTVRVTSSGSGGIGSVATTAETTPAIDCSIVSGQLADPLTCAAIYPDGSTLTLTAVAQAGTDEFVGWVGGGCGADATCAVTLGSPTTTVTPDFRPLEFAVTDIETGVTSCAVSADGGLYCWGAAVGDGTALPRLTPTAVLPSESFIDVSVTTAGHNCGVTTAGAAYCWGLNDYGQLGDGTTTQRDSPVPVAGGVQFASIDVGRTGTYFSYTCGLTAAGAAYCWGSNRVGNLGDGTTTTRTQPTAVTGGLAFTQLAAGKQQGHTCGLTSDGAAYCWGYNGYGQLGDGTTTQRATPTAVAGGLTFTDIAVGGGHTCALDTTGAAYCWGQNFNHEIGDGTTTHRHVPTPVATDLRFQQILLGATVSCALTAEGELYCWGEHRGPGASIAQRAVGERFSMFALGGVSHHLCGISPTGGALCWGSNNDGRIGDGTTTVRTTPVRVRRP